MVLLVERCEEALQLMSFHCIVIIVHNNNNNGNNNGNNNNNNNNNGINNVKSDTRRSRGKLLNTYRNCRNTKMKRSQKDSSPRTIS